MAITVDQTLRELEALIREFPDRMGSIPDPAYEGSLNETLCVYFLDENGMPISEHRYRAREEDGDWPPKLVTPVCIIGQWIEMFHPELKDPMFEVLSMNHTVGRLLDAPNNSTLSEDVLQVLSKAQSQQDTGKTWSQIDLDDSED